MARVIESKSGATLSDGSAHPSRTLGGSAARPYCVSVIPEPPLAGHRLDLDRDEAARLAALVARHDAFRLVKLLSAEERRALALRLTS